MLLAKLAYKATEARSWCTGPSDTESTRDARVHRGPRRLTPPARGTRCQRDRSAPTRADADHQPGGKTRAPAHEHRGSQLFVSQEVPEERATGLEPATSSLGTTPCAHPWRASALISIAWRPACERVRSRVSAESTGNVPQCAPGAQGPGALASAPKRTPLVYAGAVQTDGNHRAQPAACPAPAAPAAAEPDEVRVRHVPGRSPVQPSAGGALLNSADGQAPAITPRSSRRTFSHPASPACGARPPRPTPPSAPRRRR
jgi:hypothetical protein